MPVAERKDDLTPWIQPLGLLAMNCGSIEQLTIDWRLTLDGVAAADKSRSAFFGTRKKQLCESIRKSPLPDLLKSESLRVWEATREPFRVRNIVLHGGVARFKLKDGTEAIGFAKLQDSVYGDEHVLFLWKVVAESNAAGHLAQQLDELHSQVKAHFGK